MLYALELLFALAPSYVIQFAIGGLRLDLLEILNIIFWIFCLAVLARRKELRAFFAYVKNLPWGIVVFGCLFLIAACVSTYVSPTHARALGELTAYFIQPAITFLFAGYILRDEKQKTHFAGFLLWYVAALSVYGIFQYVTRVGLPSAWWGNANEPKRGISVFAYPNAFALFITPILAYALPLLFGARRVPALRGWLYKLLFGIGVLGLLVTLSRGGWLGLVAAVVVFAAVSMSKNVWKGLGVIALIGIIVFLATPNLRYRVELPFKGEKSTVSRFSLWHTGEKMIKADPILGKGLNGFATDFTAYNTDPNLAPLDYPHNIFLNFWVETGILGLFSFLALCVSVVWLGWKQYRKGSVYGLAAILFLVALFVHGLADAPYFKNDLALVFWIAIASTL